MLLSLLLFGCSPSGLTLLTTPELEPLLSELLLGIEGDAVRVVAEAEPSGRARRGEVVVLDGLSVDPPCEACFEISVEDDEVRVVGGGVLGVQYGAAAAMEAAGLRFNHPFHSSQPETLVLDLAALPEGLQAPEQSRRGIHLHTLHPIEGYFAMWEPGEANLADAKRIVDWLVKNRGDHLQWVAVDDIQRSDAAMADWQAHTSQILDYAHQRGVTVGLGVQLFGSGNLQQAFDLLDEVGSPEEQEAVLRERLQPVVGELDFDLINLSFGEFFGEDPETFIASVDRAYGVMKQLSPELEVSTVIHVGDDLQVTYEGEEMIYYFLAQFADPEIVPWVHTVMYYNLFEDAGGAYHHEEFDQHRELLLERTAAGEPVGYFPESAYWIAMDNSVPTALPLYVRSRHLDMAEVFAATGEPIDTHVLFSSGWEWGYWQTDVLTLRMGWALQPVEEVYGAMFAPQGEAGAATAQALVALAEAQHAWLIEARLAAYLASYDNIMELGYGLDILSQPKRVLPDELAALSDAERAAFAATTLSELAQMAGDFGDIAEALSAATEESEDPFVREARDGVAITALRASFIHAVYAAMLANLDGEAGALTEAEALLGEAEGVVARRHDALHDPRGARLLEEGSNATIYDYGYLIRADELCYWRRELLLARELRGEDVGVVPGCSL